MQIDIKVSEVLSRIVTVDSLSLEDALLTVEDMYKNEEIVKLTKSEIKLFELFITSKGSLKTYEEIESYIFTDYSGNSKRVRNLMSRLKQKLDFELFESIYGHGYKLKYKKFV